MYHEMLRRCGVDDDVCGCDWCSSISWCSKHKKSVDYCDGSLMFGAKNGEHQAPTTRPPTKLAAMSFPSCKTRLTNFFFNIPFLLSSSTVHGILTIAHTSFLL
jgi:hypothetical protein